MQPRFHCLPICTASCCRSLRRQSDIPWGLAFADTARKALQLLRHEQRQKRGGGAVRGDSAFQDGTGTDSDAPGPEQIIGSEPTPEFAAQLRQALAEPGPHLIEALVPAL